MAQPPSNMETLAGRVPADLYRWFAALQVEGATTNSDKLRVLLAQMKRQYDGSFDYVAAQSWFRDLTAPLRLSLGALERDENVHSEVLSSLIEQLCALAAILLSARAQVGAEAAATEDALVKRVFAMTEGLLRQAVTEDAQAIDPKVVRRHARATVELARLIDQ
ncbi:MAG: hypothetical protein ACKO7G_00385 [Gammaproteobacteria bacterium]